MAGPLAAAMGLDTAISLGILMWGALRGRRTAQIAPLPTGANEPSPLDAFAGPVVASVPITPTTTGYDRTAQYEYGPLPGDPPKTWGGVVPVGPTTTPQDVSMQYDRRAQYEYPGDGVKPLWTPAPGDPGYDTQQAIPGYDGVPGVDTGKPPGSTTQYEYAAREEPPARAARELALHLATRSRGQWDRAAIRAWQTELGVGADGLIGPITRAAMSRYGQYVSADKHEG